MIEPTAGRIVWYRETSDLAQQPQPMAAIVTFVHDNRKVNLTVFTKDGWPVAHTEVTLLQDADEAPWHSKYAEWMPFQKGQAARLEQSAPYPPSPLSLTIIEPQPGDEPNAAHPQQGSNDKIT